MDKIEVSRISASHMCQATADTVIPFVNELLSQIERLEARVKELEFSPLPEEEAAPIEKVKRAYNRKKEVEPVAE
jgi:hypothetical protein